MPLPTTSDMANEEFTKFQISSHYRGYYENKKAFEEAVLRVHGPDAGRGEIAPMPDDTKTITIDKRVNGVTYKHIRDMEHSWVNWCREEVRTNPTSSQLSDFVKYLDESKGNEKIPREAKSKHAGKTFKVAARDATYAKWVKERNHEAIWLKRFKKYAIKHNTDDSSNNERERERAPRRG